MKQQDLPIVFLLLSLLYITAFARERNCTVSGHRCKSQVEGNLYPCNETPTDPICELGITMLPTLPDGMSCDYCPEMHDAIERGPTYRQNVTPCRQEDGFYRCRLYAPNDNCVRRTWLNILHTCVHVNESIANIKCTDDEMTCRPGSFSRCVKRYDVNSEFECTSEVRPFYIRCHEEDEFECKISKKCLPRDWVRDGSVDCSVVGKVKDTSDEDEAFLSCNLQTEFRCKDASARCIPREMVMDDRRNCPDDSDEMQALKCYQQSEFRCEFGGRCLRRYRVNDGFPDCPDGTDENIANFPCLNQTEFDCGDGRCIPRSWVGNALLDCKSGSDERTNLTKCLEDEFMCLDGSRCLPKKYLCDGLQNCPDCSDEVEMCDEPRRFRCRAHPSVCIPWTQTCDSVIQHCEDGSDEETHLLQGFKCKNKKKTCYVPQFMVKNGGGMCTDSSDVCFDGGGNFLCARCLSGEGIISRTQLCDGIIDCRDLSDECPCHESPVEALCREIFYSSNNTKAAVQGKLDSVCNGTVEWENGLDEMFCRDKTSTIEEEIGNVNASDYICDKASADFVALADLGGYGRILRQYWGNTASKCDGRIECGSYDDECSSDCGEKLPVFCTSIESTEVKYSSADSTWLRSCPGAGNNVVHEIVAPIWLCDGLQHCSGGEDEMHCPDRIQCDAGKGITVLNGEKPIVSVSKEQECDLKADCLDSIDEMNCTDGTHFYCKGKDPLFIDQKKFLDGHADCKDYSDECPIELFAKNAFSSPTELLSNIVLRAFIWVVATTSIFGNLWVIITTVRELGKIKDKQTIGYCNQMLIVNLATADLLTGICLFILIVKSIQFTGEYCLHDIEWKTSMTCDMTGALLIISSETSLSIIIILTGLRLFSVVRPMKSQHVNRRFYLVAVLALWITWLLVALSPIWQKERFSTSTKIAKNRFFNQTVVDQNVLEKYIEITQLIGNLAGNNSLLTAPEYFTSNAAKLTFPQRYVDIEGVFGYYSSNTVCFPTYFNLSDTTNTNIFSLLIISYNTAAVLFVMVSYVIFYKKASARTIATRSDAQRKRNEKLKNRITLLVLTSASCWLPICVMAFYTSFAQTKQSLPEVTYVIAAVVILPIDSSFNPLLYSGVHAKVFNKLQQFYLAAMEKYRLYRIDPTSPTASNQYQTSAT